MGRTTYKDAKGKYHNIVDNEDSIQVAGFYEEVKELYEVNDQEVLTALQMYKQSIKFKKD